MNMQHNETLRVRSTVKAGGQIVLNHSETPHSDGAGGCDAAPAADDE